MERKPSAFFRNTACEFFPCHTSPGPENFNCLFCYCPLYALGERCGGAFHYTDRGVKSCVHCTLPHGEDGYAHILSRLPELVETARRREQPDAESQSSGAGRRGGRMQSSVP